MSYQDDEVLFKDPDEEEEEMDLDESELAIDDVLEDEELGTLEDDEEGFEEEFATDDADAI